MRQLQRSILIFSALLLSTVEVCGQAREGARAFTMPHRGICARGGATDTHPENTLTAIRAAIRLGVHMIELDVRQTSDGHPILLRDIAVDRTTNGTGNITELTLKQARQLDAGSWKHRRYRNERIPTLADALNLMPENIWVRLKVHTNGSLPEIVADAVVAAGREHQCVILCDDVASLQATSPRVLVRQRAEKTVTDGQITTSDQLKIRLDTSRFHSTSTPAALLVLSDKLDIERVTPVYHSRKSSDAPARPEFTDGEAQIIPAFADETSWIHHDLWVETEFDSDGDGRADRMHVSVTRQRQTDTQELKVPVVYISSPYFSGTASGRSFFWDPRHELNVAPPVHAKAPAIKQQHRRMVISRSHTNDWVPRGFAVVHSASPGTGLSQGCPTIGGDNESLAPKAVIDWLCGRAAGFTLPVGGQRVTAYWSTGKVGMTGTSFNGTLALAAATTGVQGLKAIIPVAPNTSYYHYYRSNGLVRHPGGYIGEDIDVLYDYINSGNPNQREFCNTHIRDQEMLPNADRTTGDYNSFWAGRDYIHDLEDFRAALLMSHAFNDWNVMPEHSVRIFEAVRAKGLPTQCYFHQGGHGGPPPMRMMNRWFSRYLYGIDNGVEQDATAWIVREGQKREVPTAYADYPHPEARQITMFPTHSASKIGGLSAIQPAEQGSESLQDDVSVSGSSLAKAESSKNRLLYVTPPLTKPLHISGTCRLSVRMACNRSACNFSCWIVALPWQEGSRRIYDNIITRGWADPQNHESLTDGEPLVPGHSYDLSFDLQPDDQIIPTGQQIGLMIFASDRDHTVWPAPGTKITIDLDETSLSIPIVGGHRAYADATGTTDPRE